MLRSRRIRLSDVSFTDGLVVALQPSAILVSNYSYVEVVHDTPVHVTPNRSMHSIKRRSLKTSTYISSPFTYTVFCIQSFLQAEGDVATETTVADLTAENFTTMTSKGFAFIVFFAPWCKHCKILKPVFQDLAKQMSDTQGLLFATVSSRQ